MNYYKLKLEKGSNIDEKNIVEVSVAMRDKEIVEFISNVIGSNVNKSYILDKSKNHKMSYLPSHDLMDNYIPLG